MDLSCIIFIAKTVNTILNKRGESEHPYLIPYFGGNALNLSLVHVRLDIGFL